jgi:hypothetical protein
MALAAASLAALCATSLTQTTTQPASEQLSLKERGEMVFKALEAGSPDLGALRAALTDVGHVEASFRSKPLRQWVEGATVVEGRIVRAPVVALNRPRRGAPPEEWIEKLAAPAREGYGLSLLKLAFAPTDSARQQRDRILAEADAKIRSGMAEMTGKFPQLARTNWGSIVDALEGRSPAGRVVIWAGHYQDDRTGLKTPVPKNDSYNALVMLRPLEWPEPPGQWALKPMYASLALMGQVHASAGDPFLDAALKKLVADALAPLEVLDDALSGRVPATMPATAPAGPAAPESRPAPP